MKVKVQITYEEVYKPGSEEFKEANSLTSTEQHSRMEKYKREMALMLKDCTVAQNIQISTELIK